MLLFLQHESFEVDLDTATEFAGGPHYIPQSSYDLVSAVQRQSEFYYNVSLPHYMDDKFLLNAIHRYKVNCNNFSFDPYALCYIS